MCAHARSKVLYDFRISCFNNRCSVKYSLFSLRFGHSQVNTHVFRLDKDGSPIKEGHGLLREMYFKPIRLENEGGVDPIFRGIVAFPAQEVDTLMVDEMRNSLFQTSAATPGKQSGFDLAAMNIQRGRDHGLPDLNTVRKNLGLEGKIILRTATSFPGLLTFPISKR